MTMGRATAVTALALLAAVGATPAAAAQGDPPAVGVVVQHDDGAVRQAVRIADLYPTASHQVVLFLDGDTPTETRRMQIAVENLEDLDNGCLRPEGRAGDTSCVDGDDEGELSDFIELTLTAGRDTGDLTCAPVTGTARSTTLRELATKPVIVGLSDNEGTLCVLATVTHQERDGDNVTQSDISRFDLRLAFDSQPVSPGATSPGTGNPGTAGPGAPGGAAPVSPEVVDGGDRLDLGLAYTGVRIDTILAGAAIALGTGALLMLIARRRATSRGPGVLS